MTVTDSIPLTCVDLTCALSPPYTHQGHSWSRAAADAAVDAAVAAAAEAEAAVEEATSAKVATALQQTALLLLLLPGLVALWRLVLRCPFALCLYAVCGFFCCCLPASC